jgi:phosphoserine phosphatase
MARGPWRLVTFDIDGTLTLVHGWQVLAERFGRRPEYERAMARVRSGEAGEDETISALLRIAEGHTVPEVETVLSQTPKLSNIPEGVGRLHAEGVLAALLTHNPAYVTTWYRRFGGFDDAGGLRGLQATEPRIGPPVDVHTDKLGCLAEMLHRHHIDLGDVIHVGDARPDAMVFEHVGAGVALNAKSPAVESAADLALRTTDFLDVVEALSGLRRRG